MLNDDTREKIDTFLAAGVDAVNLISEKLTDEFDRLGNAFDAGIAAAQDAWREGNK